ncbi:MAG: glutathione synthase [Sphingomonadales bacterium]
MKKLKVAIQMDPLDGIDINGDSSFALIEEAQGRGFEVFHYQPRDLSFLDGKVTARVCPIKVRRKIGDHYSAGEAFKVDLSEMDVVLLRQDPPFDMAYITTTHILEHIQPKTLVVNDPVSVRNAPEKLYVTHFDGLMPPTLITHNRDDILAFRAEYKDIILKPLYGNGGAGVFHVTPEDDNLNSLIETFTEFYREPMIVQKYLPEIRQGDKRIILIDGEVAGALNRVPAEGEARSNLHVGGTAEASKLTKREEEICAALGSSLKEAGLIFVGIDVIGHWLTEINVTSPTGIQEIGRFDGTNLAGMIWDAIEGRLK